MKVYQVEIGEYEDRGTVAICTSAEKAHQLIIEKWREWDNKIRVYEWKIDDWDDEHNGRLVFSADIPFGFSWVKYDFFIIHRNELGKFTLSDLGLDKKNEEN